MQLVCISDTHNKHAQVKVPDGDVLIHAGDFTMRGRGPEIAEFNRWLGTLPHPHKIVIAGNHDLMFESDLLHARALLTNAVYLQDASHTIDDVKFYGSPWTPQFGNWAFMRERAQLEPVWSNIPADTDVLITHGPPHGVRDKCPNMFNPRNLVSVGCEALAARVAEVRPRVHVFGHIHEGYGVVRDDDTTSINAAICTARYQPTNTPVCIKLLSLV